MPYITIAKPLTALTHHDVTFAWTSGHHAAFNTLKSVLIALPILHNPDPSKCNMVYTDASDDASGAQLSQELDGQELPLHFSSTCLQTPNGNGALPKRKPMAFTMLYQS